MYSTSDNFSTSSPTVSNVTARQERLGNSTKKSEAFETSRGISLTTTPSAFLTVGGSAPFLPATLENIEQTFIEFSSVPVSQSAADHAQSGFVPPVIDPVPQEQAYPRDLSVQRAASVHSRLNPSPAQRPEMVTTNNGSLGLHEQIGNWHVVSSPPHTQQPHVKQGPRRHTGPRAPKNEANLSPEEAERRRVRRERNKLAAAKCRKRRMDHTAQLQEETEELESIQKEIHAEILSLQKQKEQLEFILEAHKVQCKRGIPISTLPTVYVPPLTLSSDADMKPDFGGNLSNDSHSSTTSTSSPAPAVQSRAAQSAPSTVSAAAVSAPTVVLTSAPGMPTVGAASRPTSLNIVVKQEPQVLKQEPRDSVNPESMDVSVTQATGISISTPKVSPRVLSFFDTMGDHTGLTPITGGGIGSGGTPMSGSSLSVYAPQMKIGGGADATPTDRAPEKSNSHTLMSL